MIYDRTAEDIENAKAVRVRLQSGEELTEDDVIVLERGCMTVNTINRINDKQTELKNQLNDMGYWDTGISVMNVWETKHVFRENHFKQLIDNANILRNAFFVYSSTPSTPSVSYHYTNVNALEKILFDLGEMICDVKNHYRICGDFECGEE